MWKVAHLFGIIVVDLVLYKLIKIDILILCFLPLCCWCAHLIPFVLLYSITFADAKHSSIIRTTELKPRQYIFAAHPHGVLPLGICLNIGTNATDIDQLFPGIVFRGVAVSACYIIPFYRDLCLAVGGTDCRESTIRSRSRRGRRVSSLCFSS